MILVNFPKNVCLGIGTESFSLFPVLVFQIILKNSRLVQSFGFNNYFWVHWAFFLIVDISLFSPLVSSWVLWLFFPLMNVFQSCFDTGRFASLSKIQGEKCSL